MKLRSSIDGDWKLIKGWILQRVDLAQVGCVNDMATRSSFKQSLIHFTRQNEIKQNMGVTSCITGLCPWKKEREISNITFPCYLNFFDTITKLVVQPCVYLVLQLYCSTVLWYYFTNVIRYYWQTYISVSTVSDIS